MDSLTVDHGRRAGFVFLHKMLQCVSQPQFYQGPAYNNYIFRLGRAKSHIIFCDTDLNTIPGVYLNAYQNFLVVAMRMHHYLRSWGANIRKNLKFIHSMAQLFSRLLPNHEVPSQGQYNRLFGIHMR